MRDQKEIHSDSSLKDINENIHWNHDRQQHSRKMFLTKLEQVSSPKRKSWIKRSMIPVIATVLLLGTTTTLFLSENSVIQQQSESIIENNNTNESFEIWMDEEVESSIMEINQSGFDLKLPEYSPIENTEIRNVRLRDSEPTVNAVYFDEEGNELFTFMQEDISELNANTTSHSKDRMQENADYETEINGNVTFVSENDQSGLRTINIITNKYGFTLSAYNLSEEQLLNIGESIEP